MKFFSEISTNEFFAIFSEIVSGVNFIHIGANDGVLDDPICDYIERKKWCGMLIEPVPYLYKKLCDKYRKSKRIDVLKCAVGLTEGVRKFHYIEDPLNHFPDWIRGINSFSIDHILKQKRRFPNIEDFIVEIQVNCISLTDLFSKFSHHHCHLLLVDVEGFDHEIIYQISKICLLPDVIVFEHKSMEPHIDQNCNSILRQLDYDLYYNYTDTLCILKKTSNKTLHLTLSAALNRIKRVTSSLKVVNPLERVIGDQ